MFNKKAIKNLRQRIDQSNSEIVNIQRQLSINSLSSDRFAECDGCGCLLLKSEKFKQPSTVEIVEETYYNMGYSGVPPMQPYATTKKEVIKEHYKCLRCADKMV